VELSPFNGFFWKKLFFGKLNSYPSGKSTTNSPKHCSGVFLGANPAFQDEAISTKINLNPITFGWKMAFSKAFPKTVPGSNYPFWEEFFLTEEEEKQVEEDCRRENLRILDESLQEAKKLAIKKQMNEDAHVVKLAVALFEKRASHLIFWKEMKAKEKFNEKNKHSVD
jgi:hypothetical protein